MGSAYKDGDLVKGSFEKLVLMGVLLWAIPRWQEVHWPLQYVRDYMYGMRTFFGTYQAYTQPMPCCATP